MRSVKLKHTEASFGRLSLQDPRAEPGMHGGVFTLEITEVPESVPDSRVLHLAGNTLFVPSSRYSYPFSQIGVGKIIK